MSNPPTITDLGGGAQRLAYSCGCVSVRCAHNVIHSDASACENRLPNEAPRRCYGRYIGDCDGCCA